MSPNAIDGVCTVTMGTGVIRVTLVFISFITTVMCSGCVQMERVRVGSDRRRRRWSVARQLLMLQVVIVGVLVSAGATLAYLDAAQAVDRRARDTVTAVAATLVDAPNVRAALAT